MVNWTKVRQAVAVKHFSTKEINSFDDILYIQWQCRLTIKHPMNYPASPPLCSQIGSISLKNFYTAFLTIRVKIRNEAEKGGVKKGTVWVRVVAI